MRLSVSLVLVIGFGGYYWLPATEAAVQCACSTLECVSAKKTYCTTEVGCYVEVIPRHPLNESSSKAVRGCLEDSTSLLCENQRPSQYRGTWPVLYCCKGDWCNRDVLPTYPPWVQDIESVSGRTVRPGVKKPNSTKHEPDTQIDYDFVEKVREQLFGVRPTTTDPKGSVTEPQVSESLNLFTFVAFAVMLILAVCLLAMVILLVFVFCKRKKQTERISTCHHQKVLSMERGGNMSQRSILTTSTNNGVCRHCVPGRDSSASTELRNGLLSR